MRGEPDNARDFRPYCLLQTAPAIKFVHSIMRIYAATIFLSAFLLFQVEPMLAKYILPWFGGTASVWNTCLLFFQVMLVAGYLYAHLVGTRLGARSQVIVHLVLVLGCALLMALLATMWKSPIMPGASWKPGAADFPIVRILVLLTVSVGLPYFVLSSTGPLLQSWFARTYEGSPYRLYSLSNLGSLLALLSYPLVVEPALQLRIQGLAWAAIYLLFALGIAHCAWGLWKSPGRLETAEIASSLDSARPSAGTFALWVLLAACASLMLIASTNQMSQDIAPIPFLWILPLALYLISFIVCFDNERWYRRAIFHPALIATIFLSLILLVQSDRALMFFGRHFGAAPNRVSLSIQIGTAAALLFTVCMVCHGELVRLRPHSRSLTAFYLMVALGGAFGGIIGAIVAPLLFRDSWELRLAISIATVLMFIVLLRDQRSWIHQRRPALAIALLIAALALPQLIGIGAVGWGYDTPQLLVLAAGAGLFLFGRKSRLWARPGILAQFALLATIVIIAGLSISSSIVGYRIPVLTMRNFYGIFRVMSNAAKDPEMRLYQLWSGRIMHGEQFAGQHERYQPTSYYGPTSGIGLLMANYPNRLAADPKQWPVRVAVVGLGTGTLAVWGELGDYFRYYEINPAIIHLATDPGGYFTYVRDSNAKVDIISGDARLSMERELAAAPPQKFDILVIDAFSGDAIPVHLLTREAIELYLRQLKPDGVLALHISNRFLNLAPLAHQAAQEFKLHGGVIYDRPTERIYDDSDWVLLSRSDQTLGRPEIAAHMKSLNGEKPVRLWTDDYSNLVQLIR
jgi:SAM-dependent methyltransferase